VSARRRKRGFLGRLFRALARHLWRRTKRGAKARAKRVRAAARRAAGPKVVRNAASEFGRKRKPSDPLPVRTVVPPEVREHPKFQATVGIHTFLFTLHPDDEMDDESLTLYARSAAVQNYGVPAMTWEIHQIVPMNGPARLAVPETLYLTGGLL
jgi:hypothetical protein